MSFTALIVLHDSAAHLRRLLESIDARLADRPQVICIDSGSSDDGAQIARAWGAEVVELGANPGFGAANDAGIELARHPVTVLLNPDCVLLDHGVARLAQRAAGRRALLVPRLLNPDGSLQRSAHPVPGSRESLLAAVVPPRILPPALRDRLEPFRAGRPRRVGWAIAACVAAPTTVLQRLGPFDPHHFLFYEDLDLCLRAGAAGVPTILQPDIALVHVGGHSTLVAFSGEAFGVQARRRREVVRANLGDRALARDDRAQALTYRLRALAGRERERNGALLVALREAQNSPS